MTWDTKPREGETSKQWLARLIREGCPAGEWCRLADAYKAERTSDSSADAVPPDHQ